MSPTVIHFSYELIFSCMYYHSKDSTSIPIIINKSYLIISCSYLVIIAYIQRLRMNFESSASGNGQLAPIRETTFPQITTINSGLNIKKYQKALESKQKKANSGGKSTFGRMKWHFRSFLCLCLLAYSAQSCQIT